MCRQPRRNQDADDEEREAAGVSKEDWDKASAWDDEDGADAAPGDAAGLRNGSFVVWPENWRTVHHFLLVQRCWRLKPMGSLMGYDWIQVEARLRQCGVHRPRSMRRELDRLAMMETPALQEINRE